MKQHSPSADRNQGPISEVLRGHLPKSGLVLEVASGSGQHVVAFAARFAHLEFQPSDPDARARSSIDARAEEAGLANVRPALNIDARSPEWPVEGVGAIININMVHISEWSASEGLFDGAGRHLPPGGLLFLYGPFFIEGRVTAPSNETFDGWLRSQNPAWGVRLLEDVTRLAEHHGLQCEGVIDMPRNNVSVIFRKGSD